MEQALLNGQGQGAGNVNQVVREAVDAEPLRDRMADWFVADGAHPCQDVAAFRTSDQLRH